jgi:hypothetical protein
MPKISKIVQKITPAGTQKPPGNLIGAPGLRESAFAVAANAMFDTQGASTLASRVGRFSLH